MLICRLDITICLCLPISFVWDYMSESLLCVDRSLITLRALQLSTTALLSKQRKPGRGSGTSMDSHFFTAKRANIPRSKIVASTCMYSFEGPVTLSQGSSDLNINEGRSQIRRVAVCCTASRQYHFFLPPLISKAVL